MKIPQKIKPWIKISALIVGIIADGIMLFACFISQAHDPMSQVAFGALGIMIIFLIPITYEEKGYKLWLALVLVAVFFDTSYLLATTENRGSAITVATDKELLRLENEITSNKLLLESQIVEYNKAAKRETLAEINVQIQTIRNDLKQKESERKSRYEYVSAGFASEYKINAGDIFGAIPKALTERFVQLAMYLLISIIIQGMIVFSLSEPSENRKTIIDQLRKIVKPEQPIAEEKQIIAKRQYKKRLAVPGLIRQSVQTFIDLNWRKDNPEILDETEFLWKSGMDNAEYKNILNVARNCGAVKGNIVAMRNKKQAMNLIIGGAE